MQKSLILLHLFKSSMMPHFLAFSSHSRFCVNNYIAKNEYEMSCNISSGRHDVRLQVIQSFLKFIYLFSLIKYF